MIKLFKLVLAITGIAISISNAHAGRWLSRDPIQEGVGFVQRDALPQFNEPNLYAFVGNNSVNYIDPFGLCKVYSSGFRYRVVIADLDAHQIGTPYADLAKFAKGFLDASRNYAPLGMTAPNFTSSGPFTFANPGPQPPAGTFVAAHYLFYADWEIDESDGPCSLNVSETGTIQRGNNPPQAGPPRSGAAPAGTWIKADRKRPSATCGTKTLIFVDAPGSRAYLKQFPGIPATFGGFVQTVNQKLEVVDQGGKVISTLNHSVTIGLDNNGGLIANP